MGNWSYNPIYNWKGAHLEATPQVSRNAHLRSLLVGVSFWMIIQSSGPTFGETNLTVNATDDSAILKPVDR